MKFLFLVIWDPARAFDWLDYRKTPPSMDHTKVVPDLVLAVLLALVALYVIRTTTLPPILYPILLVTGAFGASMWSKFLASRSVVQTTTESVTRIDQPLGAPTSILDVGYPPVASQTVKTVTEVTPPATVIPAPPVGQK